jgi:hypothetical protein
MPNTKFVSLLVQTGVLTLIAGALATLLNWLILDQTDFKSLLKTAAIFAVVYFVGMLVKSYYYDVRI